MPRMRFYRLLVRRQNLKVVSITLTALIVGCIPVIRTEYLSPAWRGNLIDIETTEPMANVRIKELFSGQETRTNQQGFFLIPATKQKFSFKLPAASMMNPFRLEIQTHQKTLTISKIAPATMRSPLDFDLGNFYLNKNIQDYSITFTPSSTGDPEILSDEFVRRCGEPLENAVTWSKVARELLKQDSPEAGNQYRWAYASWEYAREYCFRKDYENGQLLDHFFGLFLQEFNTSTHRE